MIRTSTSRTTLRCRRVSMIVPHQAPHAAKRRRLVILATTTLILLRSSRMSRQLECHWEKASDTVRFCQARMNRSARRNLCSHTFLSLSSRSTCALLARSFSCQSKKKCPIVLSCRRKMLLRTFTSCSIKERTRSLHP